MSCYKTHDAVFDTGLRRAGRITDVRIGDFAEIDVVADNHSNQTSCCHLRSLNPRTESGRHNLKLVRQIEALIARLR
jgi:hypothetical protein